MAKESMKAREVKRAKLVEKYAEKRARLKEEGDWTGLQKLPKNSSKIRLHNRCKPDDQRVICANSESAGLILGKWPPKVSFPELKRQVGNRLKNLK